MKNAKLQSDLISNPHNHTNINTQPIIMNNNKYTNSNRHTNSNSNDNTSQYHSIINNNPYLTNTYSNNNSNSNQLQQQQSNTYRSFHDNWVRYNSFSYLPGNNIHVNRNVNRDMNRDNQQHTLYYSCNNSIASISDSYHPNGNSRINSYGNVILGNNSNSNNSNSNNGNSNNMGISNNISNNRMTRYYSINNTHNNFTRNQSQDILPTSRPNPPRLPTKSRLIRNHSTNTNIQTPVLPHNHNHNMHTTPNKTSYKSQDVFNNKIGYNCNNGNNYGYSSSNHNNYGSVKDMHRDHGNTVDNSFKDKLIKYINSQNQNQQSNDYVNKLDFIAKVNQSHYTHKTGSKNINTQRKLILQGIYENSTTRPTTITAKTQKIYYQYQKSNKMHPQQKQFQPQKQIQNPQQHPHLPPTLAPTYPLTPQLSQIAQMKPKYPLPTYFQDFLFQQLQLIQENIQQKHKEELIDQYMGKVQYNMYVMEKNKLSNPFRMYDKGDDVGEEEKSYSFVNGVMKNQSKSQSRNMIIKVENIKNHNKSDNQLKDDQKDNQQTNNRNIDKKKNSKSTQKHRQKDKLINFNTQGSILQLSQSQLKSDQSIPVQPQKNNNKIQHLIINQISFNPPKTNQCSLWNNLLNLCRICGDVQQDSEQSSYFNFQSYR